MASAPLTPSSSSLDHLSSRRRKLEQLHRKTLSFSGAIPPSNLGVPSKSDDTSRKKINKPSSPLKLPPSFSSTRLPPSLSLSTSSKLSSKLAAASLPSPTSSSSSSSSSSVSNDNNKKKGHHRLRLPKDFDKAQVRKSCTALLKHAHTVYSNNHRHYQHQQQTSIEDSINDLGEIHNSSHSFEGGEPIYLNIQTLEEIASKRAIVPYLIPLPNRIRPKLSDLSVCLITRDPRAPIVTILESDPRSPTHGVFTEIISQGKLRSRLLNFGDAASKKKRRSHLDSNEPPSKKTKFSVDSPHKSAPAFVKSFDIIVNDTEITPEALTHIFGPGVYLKPPGIKVTVPVPISLQPTIPEDATPAVIQKIRDTIADPVVIKNQLKYIARSSAVIKAPGKNLSILIGLSSFTPEQLMENIAAAISQVLQKQSTLIHGSWSNVKAITVKTAKSASMPIYQNTTLSKSISTTDSSATNDDED